MFFRKEKEKDKAAIHMYVDRNNWLRDDAIDRFCSATCKKAELEQKRAHSMSFHSFAVEEPNKGKIVWISSLALTAALAASRNEDASQEDVKRKIGFKRGSGLRPQDCDVILGSVYSDSHWSLLALYIGEEGFGKAYHYDSIKGHNEDKVLKIVQVLSRAGVLNKSVELVTPKDFPQQENEYECGHVVLMTVGTIASKYSRLPFEATQPIGPYEYPNISEEKIEMLREGIVKRILETQKRHRSL